MLANLPSSVHYSLEVIQEEVRYLVQQGRVSRHQHIYTLWEYFPACEWDALASELEQGGFLLRDRISDLVPREEWSND